MKKNVKFFIKNYVLRLYSIVFYIFRIFKIQNNKVLITNFRGRGYGDSTKYIAEELKKYNNVDLIWAVKNINEEFPKEIRKVKIYSLKYVYEFVTSKILINNSRYPVFVKKRRNQYYLQTWHSPLRLKYIELDIGKKIDPYYLNVIKNDSQMTDLMICGCDFSYNLYKKSFNYSGEILRCGTPRCDLFKNLEKCIELRKKIHDEYHIDDSKKIVLYAPTFRIENEKEILIDFNEIVKKNKELDEYVFLIRFHPNTKLKIDESKNVKNATYYPDMQELICACDMLITDYSSCCFDAMYADKKCILYLNDLSEYKRKNRKLYFEIEDLPFIKVYDESSLIKAIKEENIEAYQNNINEFYNVIGNYENGDSSKIIADVLLKKMEEKDDEKI